MTDLYTCTTFRLVAILVGLIAYLILIGFIGGRSIGDQFATLWASWALEQRPYSSTPSENAISKVWFGGDAGLRSVPHGKKQEDIPVCLVFEQIGDGFGGFGLAVRTILLLLPLSFLTLN